METALTDKQKKEKEEKNGGAVISDAEKVKKFYDKTKILEDKYDNRNSARDNPNSVKEKIQQEHKWVKNSKVHPTSSTVTEQLTMQTAVNMAPQGAAAIQA